MFGWRRTLLLIGAAALIVMGLVACGGGNSSSSSSTTGSGSVTAEENTESSGGGDAAVEAAQKAVEEAEAFPTTINAAELGSFSPKPSGNLFYISCDQSIEGCAVVGKGVQAAATAIGYHLEHCYEHLSNPQSGEECMAQAVAAKPDVILAQGVSLESAGKGFATAEAAGIPIISMFSADPPAPGRYELGSEHGCVSQGETLGNYVVAASNGEANALAAYVTAFTCVPKRLEGFEASLHKCSGCAVKKLEFSAAAIQSQFPQQLQAELQSDHEINYLAGMYSEPALVGAQQVRQLGLEIPTVAFDSSQPNFESLKAGEGIAAMIHYADSESGWVAVDGAARIIAGQELPEILEPTELLITENNISEVPQDYEGAKGYEEQFEQLWSGK
jgi:ribose transport system substrate-binding protein